MYFSRIPFIFLSLLATGLLFVSLPASAQDKKIEKKPATASKSKAPSKKTEKKVITLTSKKPATKSKVVSTVKTHTVKAEEFEVVLELSGIVGAAKSTRIALAPKVWTEFTVVTAVKHGTTVKKGDVILQLDTEKLEKEIRAKKEAMPLAELTLHEAERNLAVAEKTTPLDLENGRRSKMEAEESLAYYEDVELPMQIRSEKELLESSENYLSYAEEELKQLKKMYLNDDVTEETEEIILTRAQNTVNKQKWGLERIKMRMNRALDTTIPRDHANKKRNVERQQISWRSGEQSLREGLEKKQLETEQARRNHKKTVEGLVDLENDLQLMTVRAPYDGIVYLGMSQRGKWITTSTIERKLIPGGKLTAREIVMTVTSLDALQLHVSVAENQLKDLAKGQKGTATMKWNSDIKLDASVESVSYVPTSSSTYDAILNLKRGQNKLPVFPRMNATAKIKVYENKKALTVPKTAVKTEDEKSFVTLKGGKKRQVKKGHSDKTSTEILSGLKAGDVIELPKSTLVTAAVKTATAKVLSTKK